MSLLLIIRPVNYINQIIYFVDLLDELTAHSTRAMKGEGKTIVFGGLL